MSEAYAVVTFDRTSTLKKYLEIGWRTPVTREGELASGIGRYALAYLGDYGVACGPLDCRWEIVYSICNNGDLCSVTGILDENNRHFLLITDVSLIKHKDEMVESDEFTPPSPAIKRPSEEDLLYKKLEELRKMAHDLIS